MKSTYETVGGKYQQNGDYLLPNFEVPECPKVGVWGERRRKYLREYQKAIYTSMMLHGLLHFRNKLIAQGRYPDAINEFLVKLQRARRYHHG